MNSRANYLAVLLTLLITVEGVCQSQTSEGKKLVTMDDYGLWRTVTSTQLSNDGKWVTFDYSKPEAGEEASDERILQIKHLDSDKVYEVPFAIHPVFSDDARWVAYLIDINREEAKKLRDNNKPVKRKAQLLDLETGEKVTWDNAKSFAFSSKSNALYIRQAKNKSAEHSGSDAIVYDIRQKLHHHLGSVSDLGFNKQGTFLAYIRDAADKTANGLYVLDLESYIRTPLDQDALTRSQMTWDEEGTALAVLKGNKDKDLLLRRNQLIAFTGLGSKSLTKSELNSTDNKDFPRDMVVSERGRLTWSSDASKIFFGIKEQEPDPKFRTPGKEKRDSNDSNSDKITPASDVDIWHWKDVRIQSVQRARARRESRFTYRAVYNLPTKKFVRLADLTMKRIEITGDGKWGVGRNEEPYVHDYNPIKADYYRVDTETGERLPILKALKQPMGQCSL